MNIKNTIQYNIQYYCNTIIYLVPSHTELLTFLPHFSPFTFPPHIISSLSCSLSALSVGLCFFVNSPTLLFNQYTTFATRSCAYQLNWVQRTQSTGNPAAAFCLFAVVVGCASRLSRCLCHEIPHFCWIGESRWFYWSRTLVDNTASKFVNRTIVGDVPRRGRTRRGPHPTHVWAE